MNEEERPLEEPNEDQLLDEWLERQHEENFPEPLPAPGDVFFRTTKDLDRLWAQKTFSPQQTYLTGYERAAEYLFEEAAKQTQKERESKDALGPILPITAEHWFVYPIYFLYRHLIELSLKDILRSQQEEKILTPEQEKLITSCHEPYKLWEAARPAVLNIAGKALAKSTPAFESILREIETHDPNAEAGRYHVKHVGRKKTRRLVATFEDLTPIDVVALRDGATKILNYIRWIWSLYEENAMKAEQVRWIQQKEAPKNQEESP